jgi:hypothetical protein
MTARDTVVVSRAVLRWQPHVVIANTRCVSEWWRRSSHEETPV